MKEGAHTLSISSQLHKFHTARERLTRGVGPSRVQAVPLPRSKQGGRLFKQWENKWCLEPGGYRNNWILVITDGFSFSLEIQFSVSETHRASICLHRVSSVGLVSWNCLLLPSFLRYEIHILWPKTNRIQLYLISGDWGKWGCRTGINFIFTTGWLGSCQTTIMILFWPFLHNWPALHIIHVKPKKKESFAVNSEKEFICWHGQRELKCCK